MSMQRRSFLFGSAAVAAVGAGAFMLRGTAPTPALAAEEKFEVTLTDAEWRKKLTPAQYNILRQQGTEPPFTSPLLDEHRAGTFACAGCDLALFDAATKFESGTGWPSFNDPIEGSVETSTDRSWGMVRTEVHCANCGSHLGHVFEDGPPPTGLRYCVNGVALDFHAA